MHFGEYGGWDDIIGIITASPKDGLSWVRKLFPMVHSMYKVYRLNILRVLKE